MGYHWSIVLPRMPGDCLWSTSGCSTGVWEAGHLPTYSHPLLTEGCLQRYQRKLLGREQERCRYLSEKLLECDKWSLTGGTQVNMGRASLGPLRWPGHIVFSLLSFLFLLAACKKQMAQCLIPKKCSVIIKEMIVDWPMQKKKGKHN